MYELLFEKRIFKDLDKIPDHDLPRIQNTIHMLSQNPLPPNSKKLMGERNMYRVRQGSYRIIYTVDHQMKEIHVLAVRHRKEAYR